MKIKLKLFRLQFLGFILSVILVSGVYSQDVFHGCPMEGKAKREDTKESNKLKNRYKIPASSDYDTHITLDKILEPGDDIDRFSSNNAVTIEGYVYNVKSGGKETCNCGSSKYKDIHIEIVPTAKTKTYKKRVIVEITPRLQNAIFGEMGISTLKELKSLIKGKKVIVKGWLFFDMEHVTEAENTDSGDDFGRKNWRATCWEIHPVISIEVME